MKKRLIWVIWILVVFLIAALLFSKQIFSFVEMFFSLDEEKRNKIFEFTEFLLFVFGIIAFLFTFLNKIIDFVFGKNAQVVNPSTILPSPMSFSDMEQCYYDNLLKECRKYNLSILDRDQAESETDVTLCDVYHDQYVKMQTDEFHSDDHRPNPDKHGLFQKESVSSPLFKALGDHKGNLFLLNGIVGSGKSSFINYLASQIILSRGGRHHDRLPKSLIGGDRQVVRIQLRKIGARITPGADHHGLLLCAVQDEIQEYLLPGIKDEHGGIEVPKNDMDRFSREMSRKIKKDGVVLLDGLDEVSLVGGKRQIILNSLRDFLGNNDAPAPGKPMVILTSRPHGLKDGHGNLIVPGGFVRYDLEPMRMKQVEGFIHGWYQQMKDIPEIKRDTSGYQKRAVQLIRQIKARKSLADLTETPMLLTLLLVVDSSGTRLPESRAELYARAVHLLLKRWHRNLAVYLESAEPEEREVMDLLYRDTESTKDLRNILCKLALTTFEEAQNQASEKKDTIVFKVQLLLGFISQQYGQSMDTEAIRYFLQFRSNILAGVGQNDDQLQFIHRSFHEFFAAEAFELKPSGLKRLDEIIKDHGKRDWWREVLLFWMNGKAIGELIRFVGPYVHRKLDDVLYDDMENHAGIINLCSQALSEARLENHAISAWDEDLLFSLKTLQNKLAGLMHDKQLSPALRAECGQRLGRLGDWRPHVGAFREDGHRVRLFKIGKKTHAVPDIHWEKIPGNTFQMVQYVLFQPDLQIRSLSLPVGPFLR